MAGAPESPLTIPEWDPPSPRAGLCWQEVPELTGFHLVWQEQQHLLVFAQL